MNNLWKMEEFSALEIQENMKSNKFVVPKYQRGVVWSSQQKTDLVDTIKKGLPFGVLLLYKEGETYQIIDGLQRSNSIIEYVKNPTQFFDENDVSPIIIKEITNFIGVSGNRQKHEESVKVELIKWVQEEHKTMSAIEAMQFPKFGKIISDHFPTCKGKEFEIGDLIEPMMKKYISICSTISNTRIPAIVMSGDSELLPDLFERINSKGTQLSKYQIYAATWVGKKYKLESDKLQYMISINRARYDTMLDGNSKLDQYDPSDFMQNKELDTFELAFGFGKLLYNNYPNLFGSSSEEKTVESIGFTLINCCLGMKNKDIKILNSKLDERIGNEYIEQFLLKILDCVDTIDKIIGKYSNFKSNSRKMKTTRTLHTEFQIVSIITSIFLLKHATSIVRDTNDNITSITYDLSRNNIKWKKQQKKIFDHNIERIYIMEVLQKRWAGTGDKKMDMILINTEYYIREVTDLEYETTLNFWFETMNNERKEFKRIATPKEPELLIIAALYLSLFTAGQQIDGTAYDIEHLAPQAVMKEHLDRFDGELRLPISSIGNLCLLPEQLNRSKKQKTLYSDTKYLESIKMPLNIIETKYSFTTSTDLEWIEDNESTKEEFEDAYYKFINTRFARIKEQLLKSKFN